MGNWRSVTIVGHIDPSDAGAARRFVAVDLMGDLDRWHCLAYYGFSLCGLGQWVPEQGGVISAYGNLSERDYGPEDVVETLERMVAVAPSLAIKVHCGGDWESVRCVATVTAAEGVVTLGPPELSEVGEGITERSLGRLAGFLGERRPS